MRSPVTMRSVAGYNQCYLVLYENWLNKQPVAGNTRRSYFSCIKQFLLFLNCADLNAKSLERKNELEEAARLYLAFLKQSNMADYTINTFITSLANFSQFLGFEITQIKRAPRKRKCARTLTAREKELLCQVIQKQPLARDRALALIMVYSGLRLGTCADLTLTAVGASASFIRSDNDVIVPLNEQCKMAMREWLEERQHLTKARSNSAIWLTNRGQRLSASGITYLIKRIGKQAGISLSAEMLRRPSSL